MGERMTEEQLLQKIYQAVANTGVTYKQIDCDLDEQGDMTIFFSGLKQNVMTKEEVLNALTNLYDMCVLGSSEPDDGWSRIAGAISTAEDVARQESTDD